MGNKRDSLGDRMKRYENVAKTRLVRRMPVIIRLDGKAFHTFTRGFVRPFDSILMQTMDDTMKYLCENIQGCVLGYKQSDEISLVLIDYQTLTTDAWFDYNVEKMCSIAASMATLAFNRFFIDNAMAAQQFFDTEGSIDGLMKFDYSVYERKFNTALFDARVFNVPKEEVANCLIWRQQDATRNSIQLAGQSQFSHRELDGKSCNQIQDMLFCEKGINWNDFRTPCKRGTCCVKKEVDVPAMNNSSMMVQRRKWVVDNDIPIFSKNPDYINSLICI